MSSNFFLKGLFFGVNKSTNMEDLEKTLLDAVKGNLQSLQKSLSDLVNNEELCKKISKGDLFKNYLDTVYKKILEIRAKFCLCNKDKCLEQIFLDICTGLLMQVKDDVKMQDMNNDKTSQYLIKLEIYSVLPIKYESPNVFAHELLIMCSENKAALDVIKDDDFLKERIRKSPIREDDYFDLDDKFGDLLQALRSIVNDEDSKLQMEY